MGEIRPKNYTYLAVEQHVIASTQNPCPEPAEGTCPELVEGCGLIRHIGVPYSAKIGFTEATI
jgi:hypothetical protein